jgi:DNA-binding beta-propeller fold protein YncE
VVGGHSGEGIYAVFQPVIDSLVEEFDERGRIDRTPLELVLEKDAIHDSVISFPGKVLADADGQRLFIADTNHHRIVIADLATGEVVEVAGTGVAGYGDGDFESAQFDQPQGMALSSDGTVLYLADTGTHTVRVLDLAARRVATILGTGSQAATYPPEPGEQDVAISSPWDVASSGDTLYIAMAGSHQIWSLDLESGAAGWFVGNGRESTRNGPRLDAELAQPSAVVVVGDRIAFADSESSAIRYAELADGGVTGVLAGTDENLFDFGDVDGVGTAARLQHPLGLDLGEGTLWVADTYNSKIKTLDPATLEIAAFAGGEQGWADGVGAAASFSEPGGVSYADGMLFVADTNNHAVRRIEVATGEVSTLVLYGIERFRTASAGAVGVIDLGAIEVAAGVGTVEIDVSLPEGYKLNDLAPFSITWASTSTLLSESTFSEATPSFPLVFEAEFTGAGEISAEVTTYYCTDDAEALCFIDQAIVRADVVVVEGAPLAVTFNRTIPDPGF